MPFSKVSGLSNYETEALTEYVTALTTLESKYGAVGLSTDPTLKATRANGYFAAVSSSPYNPAFRQGLLIGAQMRSADNVYRLKKEQINRGHSMPCKMDRQTILRYTVTHEYGHMLHNALASRSGANKRDFLMNAKRDIEHIASTKYGYSASKHLSTYGASKPAEFFAEAFANAHLGAPNALGYAMQDYLAQQGF